MSYDPLIYGIDPTERITSIEVEDGCIVLFKQDKDGKEETEFRKNKFWLLGNNNYQDRGKRLKGDLHYKYAFTFENREEFMKARQVLRAREPFSVYDPKESAMIIRGITSFKGMKHNEVSLLSFDLETTGLVHDETSKVLLISNTFREASGKVHRKLFAYDDYETDADMLLAWVEWVQEVNPAFVVGHNIFGYDLPYLQHVADMNGVELRLGKNTTNLTFNAYSNKFRIDGTRDLKYTSCKVYGREIIDTLFLAYKYDVGRKYESYALKKIIAAEGLEVEGRQFYDASKIKDNYLVPEEWAKIKQYAIHDADDALALYDLMIPPLFYWAQSVPKSFQAICESATGSQINSMMVRSYLQSYHSVPKADMASNFEGAISIGTPGLWKNVFKVDVASLYPSIILEYNVYDNKKDPEGNFLKLVKTFTERRLEHKKLAKKDKYYDDLQASEKIAINSAYGFLGTTGLLFNSPGKASFVTQMGREILQKAIDWANGRGFDLVNADTDSIAFCSVGHKGFSDEERKVLLEEINRLFPEKIKFEDDGYYPKVLVLKAKNYVLFDGKKLNIKGSALKGSTKEPALRDFMKEIINALLNEDKDFLSIYHKYVRMICDVKDMKSWATRKTISRKTLTNERTNEKKVRDALEGSEYTEGDRVYMFFKEDGSQCLLEKFSGDYSKDLLFKKLHDTVKIFDTVLDVKQFPNMKLKRNQKLLEEMMNDK